MDQRPASGPASRDVKYVTANCPTNDVLRFIEVVGSAAAASGLGIEVMENEATGG